MNNQPPPVKILLVDDNEANLLALEALLSDVDATCVKVTSGKEALKCLLNQEFALILLDVQMPGMDGLETAAIIRQREKNETIPIIFVTAYHPSETNIFQGYALGAVDYIVKPIVPEILLSKVKVFIQLFQQNSALKQEIEEHKRTQEALFFEKELAQITLKSIGDAVITTNADGYITSLNHVAEHLTGWSEQDVVGLPLTDVFRLINAITKETVANPLLEALEQLKIINLAQNTLLIARDGREFDIDDSTSPIQDHQGNILGGVIVFRDITDYKLREAAKLNRILNSAIAAITSYRAFPDGTWISDYWSEGCETIVGYSAQELIADPNLWANNVHPEDLAVFIAQTNQDDQQPKSSHVEYRFRHQDGTWRWLSASIFFEWDQTHHCWNVTGVLTDITQRKQAEMSLREAETIIKQQEQQFRLALDLTQTGIWDWDLKKGVIHWNDSHYTLLGYQPGEVESTYQAWRDRVHPDDLTKVEQKLLQAQENNSDYEAEYRVIYSDGAIHWVLGKGQGIYDEAGQLVRMLGTIVDITQRKQTEIALREEEAKLSLFVKYAPVSVAMFDQQMRYLTVSQRWLEMYHLSSEEAIIGHSHYEIFPNISDTWKQSHQQSLAGATQKCEQDYFILPDGSEQWLNWEIQPWWFDNGEVGGIVIFVEDITKRQQAEINLHQTQENLNIAIEAAQMGTWYLDLINDVAPVRSPRYDQIFGYNTPPTEWGQAIARQHVLEADREIFDAAFASARETGNLYLEVRIQWADGSIHWMAARGRFYFDDNGNPLYAAGVNLDISDRKQAEINLKEQIEKERLVTNIAQNIRQTLNLNQILQTTVDQVRELLQGDRVMIFRFDPDGDGTVIAESLVGDWTSMLNQTFHDDCCTEHYFTFSQADFYARTDIFELEPCFYEFFAQFQVKACLTVPITHAQQLWGYIIVHQCSNIRQWQPTEIELLQQLAIQVSIAIQQSELYQQTLQELLERQQAQKALFDSEQKLKGLLQYAPALIFILDLENKYLFVSRYYEEMMGMTTEQLLGKSIYDIWTKEEADFFTNINRHIVENQENVTIEEVVVPPNRNHYRSFLTLKFPLYDAEGKVYAVCGFATDITERKQAERKIAEQAALINLATDAIFVHDLDDQILFWNQGAERLYGWTEAEVLGQKTQNLFNQEVELTEALQTTIKEGFWQGELEQITKTGKKIIVQSHKTLVENKFDQLQSILVVNSDITAKKELEKQFFHAQRLESLGTLASGIAHDFNNILTPILGISQLLPLKFTNLDERTENLLTVLTNSARRGADLVKQILLFSRDTEGQTVVLQVGYLLQELIGTIQQTFPKSITIEPEIPTKELWTILADATQIHQVFMNLMVNARDAMPEGGILSIIAENCHLDHHYAQMNLEAKEGAYLVVTIGDTGIGISPELIDKIFDPFFTTKGVGKGTGLGLSTVSGIVKNHGGFIKVYSELGKGTKFQVFFPATQGEVSLTIPEENLPRGNGQLILIVDDETSIQEITRVTLENYNYRTIIASDGNEALSIFAQNQQEISVVLMDMMMPNLDGIAAIRTLQQINPLVKIIATSGLITNKQLASEVNVNTFLLKPYTSSQLLQALTEVMGYQSETSNETVSETMFTDIELLKQALAEMSPEWLEQMYQAAYSVDADLMLELIAQIPESEVMLINTLKDLINDFKIDLIMELSRQA